METLGAAAPVASTTVPVIVPVTVWEKDAEVNRNRRATEALVFDLDILNPSS
jgi:hypothetical protein